jgi:hypothetical protein
VTVTHDTRAALGTLRCTHCGRRVQETRHGRDYWQVDYYALHTGEGEVASMVADADRGEITFLKLLTHVEIITCADCYRDPQVRRQRDERFQPERYAEAAE